MLTDAEGYELVLPDGFVAGDGCDLECCGVVDGFYVAYPCTPGVGCGGGELGEPLYIPVGFTCAETGLPPRVPPSGGGGELVIGVNRACYRVFTDTVYRLCPPGPVPPYVACVPAGARILAPGVPVACLYSCTHPDCLDTRPRWITLVPCDPDQWPPPEHPEWSLPIVRADGFPGGCIVGRDASGLCWKADCADVFAARPEDIPPTTPIFADGVDFSYRSCCECGCTTTPGELGCDDRYPPPHPQPVPCCCPDFGQTGPGSTLRLRARRVVREGGFYRTVITEDIVGDWAVGEDGQVTGSGTITRRTQYVGPACPGFPVCPPGVPCDSTEVVPLGMPSQPWCPAPMWRGRPCPDAPVPNGGPGYSWTGVRSCEATYSVVRWINPDPPGCGQFGLPISIEESGGYTLAGVDYGNCTGGCGESPVLGIDGRPIGGETVLPGNADNPQAEGAAGRGSLAMSVVYVVTPSRVAGVRGGRGGRGGRRPVADAPGSLGSGSGGGGGEGGGCSGCGNAAELW